jgi:hypothetical protein
MDLVKKKSIAIRPETYARLTRLAAELKLTRLDGGMVSLDMAVGVLLDKWEKWNERAIEPVSLQAYAANAEANDPKYKTGWDGIDPDKFLHENGFRGYDEPENKTK